MRFFQSNRPLSSMYLPLGAKAIMAASRSCLYSQSVWCTKFWYSGSSPTLDADSNCRMPPARKRLKSMYSTTASSVGRRLSMAAGERARERYQITPHRVRPQSAVISRISSHARVLGVTNRVSHSREFRGAGFAPQPEVGLQFAHHAREICQREGLRSVPDCLLGTRMDFHDQAVGADGHGGARKRRNQAALAGGVARVENHRQMRELVQHRNGRDIASIAGSRFKGPYAALAENYIGVAVGHDVLGRHQQLLDGGTHAALQ